MLQPREGCLAWLVGKATAKATPKALKAPCRATLTSFLLTMLVLSLQLIQPGSCSKKMHNIYWNTTNPMFRIDNTDNIIDINSGGNLPTEYDQANIICPRYRRGTRLADIENYIIYNVSRDEYENCRIVNPKPRIIAVCDKPHQLIYFTITFRSFTPTPGGLEFEPGVDYFFISTSSRSDLYRQVGGRCTSHNMKLVFKVADNRGQVSQGHSLHHPSKAVNVPRTPSFEDPVIHNSGGEERPKLPGLMRDYHSYLYPTRDFRAEEELDTNSVDLHSRRSQLQYDHDVSSRSDIKQEASVMNSSAAVSHDNVSSILLTLSLAVMIQWWW